MQSYVLRKFIIYDCTKLFVSKEIDGLHRRKRYVAVYQLEADKGKSTEVESLGCFNLC